eukprot:7342662-Pyramimonas_sp.AAC.1
MGPEMDPQPSEMAPKTAPRSPETALRGLQDAQDGLQDGDGAPLHSEAPKMAFDRVRRARSPPRRHQMALRWPKTAKEALI